MDIFRFVNSKAIREHLRNIGYEFNALEAAWLIYQCCDATIGEKHKAWNEIIEKMPDRPIEKRLNTAPQASLHAYLKRYMKLEEDYIDRFYGKKQANPFDDNDSFVYQLRYVYKDGMIFDQDDLFSHLDRTTMRRGDDVAYIRCTKMQIDGHRPNQILYFTPSFEPLHFQRGRRVGNEEEDSVYRGVFDGLWFDFPTPFRKGDIVWDPKRPRGLCAGPFVTTGVGLDGIERDKVKNDLRKNGDTTDMCARGFFLCKDGSIYEECMSNYMELEFYDEQLTGPKRTLIALSHFLKGEIDLALFARAYHQIIMDGYAENSMPLDHPESDLLLAGLSKPDHSKP